MKLRIFFKQLGKKMRGLFGLGSNELQPADIMDKLVEELEYKKKFGIEENPYVPNVYAVYLCPIDVEDISPLLSGIKEQLQLKLMERIKRKGYRLLSSSVSVEIRVEASLEINEVDIESWFIKEERQSAPLSDSANMTFASVEKVRSDEISSRHMALKKGELGTQTPHQKTPMTHIIKETLTKYIDDTEMSLDVIGGKNKGQVIPLKAGEYVFGRANDATILLEDPENTVSRRHFYLLVQKGQARLKNLSHTNLTKINDTIVEEADLKSGDTITAGKVQLKVA